MTSDRGRDALAAAHAYENDIVSFLRELIAIPAESGKERARCERVKAEYEKLGFAASFDGLGSVLGRVGDGPITILMDGHND